MPPDQDRRFVQLPADFERSPSEAPGPASTLPVAIPQCASGELLGVLGALLHRYAQQAAIAIDVNLRAPAQAPRLVALQLEVEGDAPLGSAIAQATNGLAAAQAVAAARPSNVAVTFMDGSLPGSLDATARAGDGASRDLHVVVSFEAAQLAVVYDAKIFRAKTIDRMVASFVALLTHASRERDTPIESLPILADDEIRALTTELASGTATYPSIPVVRLFEAQAKSTPDAVAVRCEDRALTYAELDERSSRLAHYLMANGVVKGLAVGVCIRPSLDVLVALLAVWKVGGIYLPLDPSHPPALLERMLDEAKPRVVLTQAQIAQLTLPGPYPQLCVDTEWARVAPYPATSPSVSTSLDDAAHLLYTSGTTGKAKGVIATQANLAHYIHVARQRYEWRPDDLFCSLARYTFSISLFDLVSPLCCGAAVRLVPRDDILALDRLVRVLEGVSVVHAGPSLLASLFRHLRASPSAPRAPRTFDRMHHASTGGDLVPPSVMEEMKRVFPNAEIYVIYGCTEISCMGTTFPVSREAKVTRSFVGKPFPDVTLRVLDPKRSLVPFGAVGEICFAGKGIVRGYLERPELTAEKFVEFEGQRFYQTGDLGRLHDDGNLEILGRRDFQVQLRGIRVELAGIENTVRELGLALQCAVIAKKLDVDDVRLIAFVVQPKDANVASFRRALSAHLPDYMLPQNVVVLEAMPLTANGKLDRHRLQELPWDTQPNGAIGAPPTNPLERTIAGVFASVLGRDAVGVDDDFFDLGGHSLLAVVALHEIEAALGVTFSPFVLFEHPTVRMLASHASSSPDAESHPILLNEKCAGPNLFMLSGIHMYRELAKRLDGRCSAYGVFASSELGLVDAMTPRYTVQELAREYVSIMRRTQPRGPYRLLGYSFAGSVAYEVAQQLQASGEEVRFLALLDSVIPEWAYGTRTRYRLAQLRRLVSAPRRDVLAFIIRRIRHMHTKTDSEFIRFGDDARVGPLEQQRDAINYRAAVKYMGDIRPWDGHAVLVASAVRLRKDPLKSPNGGWSDHIRSLAVETLEADHFQLLTDEPHVSQLADILVRYMDRAEARERTAREGSGGSRRTDARGVDELTSLELER